MTQRTRRNDRVLLRVRNFSDMSDFSFCHKQFPPVKLNSGKLERGNRNSIGWNNNYRYGKYPFLQDMVCGTAVSNLTGVLAQPELPRETLKSKRLSFLNWLELKFKTMGEPSGNSDRKQQIHFGMVGNINLENQKTMLPHYNYKTCDVTLNKIGVN